MNAPPTAPLMEGHTVTEKLGCGDAKCPYRDLCKTRSVLCKVARHCAEDRRALEDWRVLAAGGAQAQVADFEARVRELDAEIDDLVRRLTEVREEVQS